MTRIEKDIIERPWAAVTNPVQDEKERRDLVLGEAAFNTEKYKSKIEALFKAGIYYNRHWKEDTDWILQS
eukprot:scaffold2881_cov45-Attheya_sp.AAC.3